MNPHSHSNSGLDHPTSEKKEEQGPLSLSQQINASTREGHDVVNRLIMSRLALGLQGQCYSSSCNYEAKMSEHGLVLLDHTLYREGLLSFAFVFKAFEEEWGSLMSSSSSNINPRIKKILQNLYSTPLLRTPQLTKDLQYYFGSTPFSTEAPTTIQRTAYVAHIRQVVAEKPHVLIAYAYNYYMALFAGGKILKYQISKAKGFFPERYGMTEEDRIIAGTNLFSFEVEKGKEDGLRASFKGALGDLEDTLTVQERNG